MFTIQKLRTLLLVLAVQMVAIPLHAVQVRFDKPDQKKLLNSHIYFTRDSYVEINEKSLKLLDGDIWISETQKLKVETVYGDFVIDGKNAFISLDLKKDQVTIRLGNARALIRDRSGDVIPLNFGEEMWVGTLTRDGKQLRGAPNPVQWSWFVKEWARKFPYPEKILASKVEIRKISKDRVDTSADIQQEVVDRKIAAVKEEDRLEQARRRAASEKKYYLRKQFFDRVFFR